MKTLITWIIALLLLAAIAGCSKQTCPTYSQQDYIEYMHSDTTVHKFSTAEKILATAGIVLIINTLKE